MHDHYLESELYELIRTRPEVFDFLQAGSLDGIWYWDVANPEQEWMSPRFKEVFGYAAHEIPNTSTWWQEHIHPDELQVAIDNFESHCADLSHPYDQIVRYRHKDGSTVWVRCRGLAIRNAAGVPIRMLGAHSDVSELKRTEEALRATVRQLESANRHLDEFAHVAAHDIKEPLRGMATHLLFLREDLGDNLSPAAEARIAGLEALAGRLAAQVSALLEHSRAGHAELPTECVDLRAVVEAAIANVAGRASEEQAEIVVRGELPPVAAHGVALEKIVQNLVSNGIKYNDSKPKRIEVGVELADDGDLGRLYVRDNGIGIKHEHLEKIFGLFRRLHGRDKYGGGSGAGLTIARRLVERLGSTLEVRSTPGAGSTFYVALPLADASAGGSAKAAA